MTSLDKNILLTGGSGFLGGYILSAFEKFGYTVYTVGRTKIQRNNHIVADISSSNLKLPDIKFHSIVHVAGKAHSYPKTAYEKNQFLSINYEGTKNIFSWFENMKSQPSTIIFISSVAVYGFEEGDNISENVIPNPQSIYGKSKLKAEGVISEWGKSKNIPFLSLRLPLIVGRNAPGNLGKMYKAISSGKYPKILENHSKKSMVLAQDVAECIVNYKGEISGVYNLTDGYHPSFHQIEEAMEINTGKNIWLRLPKFVVKALSIIGDIIERMTSIEVPISTTKLKKLTSTLTFDDSKARREIDWNPKPVLRFIENEM